MTALPFDVQADELGDEIEIVDHLLPMLNGRRSVREVVGTSIYPRFTTLRALYRLLTLGYIKAKNKKGDTVTVAFFKPEMEAQVTEEWRRFKFAGYVPFDPP